LILPSFTKFNAFKKMLFFQNFPKFLTLNFWLFADFGGNHAEEFMKLSGSKASQNPFGSV